MLPAQLQSGRSIWPTVLVQPLVNLTSNPENDQLTTGLTAELAHTLGHYREIQVKESSRQSPETNLPNPGVDFIIAGNLRRDPTGITVAIRLHGARKGFQIWSGNYPADIEAVRLISFREQLAADVAARVAGGYAEISKYLAA